MRLRRYAVLQEKHQQRIYLLRQNRECAGRDESSGVVMASRRCGNAPKRDALSFTSARAQASKTRFDQFSLVFFVLRAQCLQQTVKRPPRIPIAPQVPNKLFRLPPDA